MKACETCSNRVDIGKNYKQVPFAIRNAGMILIYLPILTLPFVFASAYLTYFHLRMSGATNLKKYQDFIPDRASHRYNLKSQITMTPSFQPSVSQSKLFWILNCTWYCPYSVALFEWHTYLVKLVENWWCPFGHEKKVDYNDAKIDQSFWHIYPHDAAQMHEDDLNNPIWNETVEDQKPIQ
jgi:hypothetical protein